MCGYLRFGRCTSILRGEAFPKRSLLLCRFYSCETDWVRELWEAFRSDDRHQVQVARLILQHRRAGFEGYPKLGSGAYRVVDRMYGRAKPDLLRQRLLAA